eukprot:jgi/Mesvir1/19222/Mv11529-RA.1
MVANHDLVVLDCGTAYSRLGFSGESAPRFIIRTPAPAPKHPYACDCCLTTVAPTTEEWVDALESHVRQIFYQYLLVNPNQRHVILTENVVAEDNFCYALAYVLIVRLQVRSISYAPLTAALWACGLSSGMLLDIGYRDARVLPVYKDVPLLQGLLIGDHGLQGLCRRLQCLEKGTVHHQPNATQEQRAHARATDGQPQAESPSQAVPQGMPAKNGEECSTSGTASDAGTLAAGTLVADTPGAGTEPAALAAPVAPAPNILEPATTAGSTAPARPAPPLVPTIPFQRIGVAAPWSLHLSTEHLRAGGGDGTVGRPQEGHREHPDAEQGDPSGVVRGPVGEGQNTSGMMRMPVLYSSNTQLPDGSPASVWGRLAHAYSTSQSLENKGAAGEEGSGCCVPCRLAENLIATCSVSFAVGGQRGDPATGAADLLGDKVAGPSPGYAAPRGVADEEEDEKGDDEDGVWPGGQGRVDDDDNPARNPPAWTAAFPGTQTLGVGDTGALRALVNATVASALFGARAAPCSGQGGEPFGSRLDEGGVRGRPVQQAGMEGGMWRRSKGLSVGSAGHVGYVTGASGNFGEEDGALASLVCDALARCPRDCRLEVARGIVLCGGGAMLYALGPGLLDDIRHWLSLRVQHAHPLNAGEGEEGCRPEGVKTPGQDSAKETGMSEGLPLTPVKDRSPQDDQASGQATVQKCPGEASHARAGSNDIASATQLVRPPVPPNCLAWAGASLVGSLDANLRQRVCHTVTREQVLARVTALRQAAGATPAAGASDTSSTSPEVAPVAAAGARGDNEVVHVGGVIPTAGGAAGMSPSPDTAVLSFGMVTAVAEFCRVARLLLPDWTRISAS